MNEIRCAIISLTQGNGNFPNREKFCLNWLLFSTRCVKLCIVDRNYTVYRKETENSDLYARDGRILHTRRDRRHSQSYRGHDYPTLEKKQDARIQIRGILESEQKRVLGVCSQAEKYSTGTTARQKIKPAFSWQSFENLAARVKPTLAWKTKGRTLWNSLPTLSITLTFKNCQWLVIQENLWACDRKKNVCS